MANNAQVAEQYRIATTTGGVYIRNDRGLISLTGADRAHWLNNFVTNVIKTLTPGEGNYAFATNAKGRTVFDVNMLVLDDRIWLDVDHHRVDAAMSHLQHHIITEDVALTDLTSRTSRAAIIGPDAHELADTLGFPSLATMSSLRHTRGGVGAAEVLMLRHDFTGLQSAELLISGNDPDAVVEVIASAAADRGFAKLDHDTVKVLRIEAGIPASVDDIDEDIVPPETGRIEDGISYEKGCYLGQEIIERLRSRGGLARELVAIHIDGDAPAPPRSTIRVNDIAVGRITSCCWSEAIDAVLALGYVKTAHAEPKTTVTVATPDSIRTGTIVSLPVRP